MLQHKVNKSMKRCKQQVIVENIKMCYYSEIYDSINVEIGERESVRRKTTQQLYDSTDLLQVNEVCNFLTHLIF